MKRASASAGTMPASASSRVASARSFRHVIGPLFPSELTAAFVGREGLDDFPEVTVEHAVERMQREADPMVGHPIVLVVVRADLLGTAAALHLGRSRRAEFGGLAVLLG